MNIDPRWKLANGKYQCPHCGKTFTEKGIATHVFRRHTEDGRSTSHQPRKRKKYRGIHTGWYKGYWCDSGWELAYFIYLFDHNIPVLRNEKRFSYVYRGKRHMYYPDFTVNGEYVEIKGILDAKNRAKIAQFPYTIRVIDKKSIKPILAYVIGKYGDEYHKLLKPSYTASMK